MSLPPRERREEAVEGREPAAAAAAAAPMGVRREVAWAGAAEAQEEGGQGQSCQAGGTAQWRRRGACVFDDVIVLCCTVLCCTVLCCTVRRRAWGSEGGGERCGELSEG